MADRYYASDVQQQFRGLESLTTDEFLTLVGQRIRFHRTAERMSRKRLAEVSGVSERYLAQLEAGQGNMSIALLRKVTTAISLPLNVLLADVDREKDIIEVKSAGDKAGASTSAGAESASANSASDQPADDKAGEKDPAQEQIAELS